MTDLASRLVEAFALVGLAQVEAFELAWTGEQTARLVFPAGAAVEAATWLEGMASWSTGEAWLRPAPLRTDRPWAGRQATDADVTACRCLVVSIAGAAALEVGREVLEVVQAGGARPSLVLAGDELAQVWVRHEQATGPAERRAFLSACRTLAGMRDARVDQDVSPSRLARLPGTVDVATQDLVEVLVAGDGRELPLQVLARLAHELDPRGCPAPQAPAAPRPGPRAPAAAGLAGPKPAAKLAAALAELPNDPRAWRWAGQLARKKGRVLDVLAAAPEHRKGLLEEGVRHEGKLERGMDDGQAKALTRAMAGDKPEKEKPEIPVRITDLVRRMDPTGAEVEFDVEFVVLGRGEGRWSMKRVPDMDLAGYGRFRTRALRAGVALPVVKEPGGPWGRILEEAFRLHTTEIRRQGTLAQAIQDEIRRALQIRAHQAPGRDLDDLLIGKLVYLQGEAVAVLGRDLMADVRKALEPDVVKREAVAAAAVELGGDPDGRPTLQDGTTVEAWVFPARVLS